VTAQARRIHPTFRRNRIPGPALGLLLAAAAVLPGGCAGTQDRAAGPAAAAWSAEVSAPTPAAASQNQRPATEAATAAVAPPPPPEKIYPEPAALKGLDAGGLAGLLGQPRFKRRDDPAEIWQYRSEACALDLFLYRGKTDTAYRVRHLEARSRDKAPTTEKDCLVGLLKAFENRRAG
jgi:hypothetical protein